MYREAWMWGLPPSMSKNGGMTYWKPHALATPHPGQIDLRNGDKVVSIVDMRTEDGTVASGTQGKVILSNGFNWQRYRVLFANGVEMGDLDQRHIAPTGRTAKRLIKAARR